MMVNLLNRLNANPVAQVTEHLLRRLAQPSGWLAWLKAGVRLVLTTGVRAGCAVLLLIELANALTGQLSRLAHTPNNSLLTAIASWLLVSMGSVTLMSVVRRTGRTAAASVIRDKRDSVRWEMILLTGVDTRTYVRGKVWAVLRLFWREWTWLALVLSGAVAGSASLFMSIRYADAQLVQPPIALSRLLSVIASLVLLAVANGCFTAVIGVTNAMTLRRGGRLGLEGTARLILGLILLTGVMVDLLTPGWSLGLVNQASALALLTLFDGGLYVAWFMIYNDPGGGVLSLDVLINAVLRALLLYGALTWALLCWAEWWGVHYGLIGAGEK